MNNVTTVIWDRTRFYESLPQNPYMYYFMKDGDIMWDIPKELPEKFLRLSGTALYEFGGAHDEALTVLKKAGLLHSSITKSADF